MYSNTTRMPPATVSVGDFAKFGASASSSTSTVTGDSLAVTVLLERGTGILLVRQGGC